MKLRYSVLLLCMMIICTPFLSFASTEKITIVTDRDSIEISIKECMQDYRVSINTERIKNEKKQKDTWTGIDLLSLFKKHNLDTTAAFQFHSDDHYMIRLSQEDIATHHPIIAIERNSQPLKNKGIRLIVPGMRDMFWIRDLRKIICENSYHQQEPKTIYIAENLLKTIPIRTNRKPFIKNKGYAFSEIAERVFYTQREFYLRGKDGIEHRLPYTDYLADAMIYAIETNWNLQSMSMPVGMWIKKIAYIQQEKKAIVFKKYYTSLADVATQLTWENIPDSLILPEKNNQKISTTTPFTDPKWENILYIHIP